MFSVYSGLWSYSSEHVWVHDLLELTFYLGRQTINRLINAQHVDNLSNIMKNIKAGYWSSVLF